MLRYGLFLAVPLSITDFITKWWIREIVMDPPQIIPLTSFFNLVLGFNTGVSFGMLQDAGLSPIVLSVISLGAALGLLVWLSRVQDMLTATGFGLLAGGALGNGFDRLVYGAVTDFLDFHVAGWHWPAFNVADIGVVCGAALLILDCFRSANGTSVSQEGA